MFQVPFPHTANGARREGTTLLDLQRPPQCEAIRGLCREQHLSLLVQGTLGGALDKTAHFAFAFDIGAETPRRCQHPQIREERVPGTCEKIGFADFSITHFQ